VSLTAHPLPSCHLSVADNRSLALRINVDLD
jgi:hypothetical protein